MSDPRVAAVREVLKAFMPPYHLQDASIEVVAAVDAVSSQYEQVGWTFAWPDEAQASPSRSFMLTAPEQDEERWEPVYRRIEHRADTRALIENRSPAETAEAKAWSDDAHARIRAGEVSGSHDLMRDKVDEYRDTQEAE